MFIKVKIDFLIGKDEVEHACAYLLSEQHKLNKTSIIKKARSLFESRGAHWSCDELDYRARQFYEQAIVEAKKLFPSFYKGSN